MLISTTNLTNMLELTVGETLPPNRKGLSSFVLSQMLKYFSRAAYCSHIWGISLVVIVISKIQGEG